MSFRWFLYKIYPIALPLYLLPISLLYAHFNNSLFAIIIAIVGLFIPLVFAHPDPELLFKEILRSLGFRNMMNSLDYQNSDYKKAVEEILKEHNLNFDVKIINSESINAFSGFSTITITKGF